MTVDRTGAWTRTSRVIRAPPEELYQGLMDPAALVAWLPPAKMRGEIHEFARGSWRLPDVPPLPAGRARLPRQDDRPRGPVQGAARGTDPAPQDRRGRQLRIHGSGLPWRDDDRVDLRRGFWRNRGHRLVQESAARLAGGGQRGRLAVVPGAVGPPLRMRASRAAA